MPQLPPGSTREKIRDALFHKPMQTVPELAKATGLSQSQVKSAIPTLIQAFLVEKDGFKEIHYPSGRLVQCPTYRLVPGAMPTRMDDPNLGIELQAIWKPIGPP